MAIAHGGVQTPAFWIANSAVYRTPPCTALENATPEFLYITLSALHYVTSIPLTDSIRLLEFCYITRIPLYHGSLIRIT